MMNAYELGGVRHWFHGVEVQLVPWLMPLSIWRFDDRICARDFTSLAYVLRGVTHHLHGDHCPTAVNHEGRCDLGDES